MTKAYRELTTTLLFDTPDTLKTYAIVDSIRDEKVTEKILFSGLSYLDLWHEELFENEQEVPLYLIELERDNDLLEYLLLKHTQSVATYFMSPFSLEALQAYYRMFSYVTIEVSKDDFQKAIFGFYDPNILPEYIATLHNKEKIEAFFAGIALWLVPNAEKEEVLYLAYQNKEFVLEDVNLQLSNLNKEGHVVLPFDAIQIPTLVINPSDVSIDSFQVEMLDDVEKVKFIESIFEEYKEESHMFYHDESTNKALALHLFSEAKGIGIVSEAGMYHYILLGLTVLRPMNELKFYTQICEAQEETKKIEIMDEIMQNIIEERKRVNGK